VGPRIALALTLHNHQPVGNFGWVIEDAYEHAYFPMLVALEHHPGIRVGLHYSGPLLEWIGLTHPDFLARLRAMVERDQIEILGGGLYEPVLAAIPERDRVAQLEGMADLVERTFGRRPQTAWLAERVWEPDLPTSLAAAGYRATILDDAHLRAAGVAEDAMWGPYTTEDQGRLITVFGTEQGLRYRIPFRPVEEVIDYLREHATEAGERLGTMGDDGEKFGAWPSTWQECWGAGAWVERFFAALDTNADWLSTVTPSAWLADHRPIGRVYVPVGSYAEMGAWALPADESRAFLETLARDRADGRPEPRWMRGASWRNFQVKYREINDLHKRMLRVSEAVAALPPGAIRTQALDHLMRGQSNDVYWHGLFGGIYLPDLRLATAANLVAAEDAANAASDRLVRAEATDVDLDGRDEVILADEAQVLTIDLDEGAGISDWDIRAARYALASVLRRRPEAYHEALRHMSQTPAIEPLDTLAGIRSIHDAMRAKEAGIVDHLRYDDHERRSGLVRFLPFDVTPDAYRAGELPDLGTAIAAPHTILELSARHLATSAASAVRMPDGNVAVTIRKELRIGGSRLRPTLDVAVTISNAGSSRLHARLGLEWSLMLLGGGGNPAAWYEIDGRRSAHDGRGAFGDVEVIRQGNDWIGLSVATTPSPRADAWWAPIETVSNSDDGFERVYQGSCLLLSWLVDLAPGGERTVAVGQVVTVAEDRATTGTTGWETAATEEQVAS
jgi:hypothetical protein